MQATVVAIYICPQKGEPMQPVESSRALIGQGLERDRYATGQGSWNKNHIGKRQITLISSRSFEGTDFLPHESRRNLLTKGIEVNTLIGKHFMVGPVLLKGIKYCDPCSRIDSLSGKNGFPEKLFERGGIIAEVFGEGIITVGDLIMVAEYGIHSLTVVK